MANFSVIGKSIPRVDAPDKVTGQAMFAADFHPPGMLIGKIKRSPYPFAKILSINADRARKLPGVKAVITAKDVAQYTYGLQLFSDELPLNDQYVRYVGDTVAAVAAIDEETAEEALDLIEVKYEKLTPILDPEETLKPGAPVVQRVFSWAGSESTGGRTRSRIRTHSLYDAFHLPSAGVYRQGFRNNRRHRYVRWSAERACSRSRQNHPYPQPRYLCN